MGQAARFFEALGIADRRPAIIDPARKGAAARTFTAKEVVERAAGLARLLTSRGAPRGGRIAAALPNGPDFVLYYLACLYGGFTAVPINPALPDAVIRHIVRITCPSLLLSDTANAGRFEGEEPPRWIVASGDLLAPSTPLPFAGEDDIHLSITFTSGTTNLPKGVAHACGAMLANVRAYNAHVGLDDRTRMMHVLPMAYMAGFLNTILSPLAAGGSVLLAPPFSAAQALGFWRPAVDYDANALWLTPTMLAFLMRANRDPTILDWTRQHLSHVMVGTAPLPAALKESAEKSFGVECLESYGMTEVLLVSGNTSRFPRKPGSTGRILPGIEMETRDNDGRPLRPGQKGNLWIRSPFALKGYLSGDGVAVTPLIEGWLDTGDVGLVDDDGDLFITGRTKDLIIRGGTNVSPRAVEEILLRCPGVVDAAVVGVPHPFWGEDVVAAIIPEEGVDHDALQPGLLARLRAELPADALPSRFIARKEFPRSVTGKVLKNILRDELADATSGPASA